MSWYIATINDGAREAFFRNPGQGRIGRVHGEGAVVPAAVRFFHGLDHCRAEGGTHHPEELCGYGRRAVRHGWKAPTVISRVPTLLQAVSGCASTSLSLALGG